MSSVHVAQKTGQRTFHRHLYKLEVTHAADTRLSPAVADKLEQHSSCIH